MQQMRQNLRRFALALSATLLAGTALAAPATGSGAATPSAAGRFEAVSRDRISGGNYALRGSDGQLGAYQLSLTTLQALGALTLTGWSGAGAPDESQIRWSDAARAAGVDSIDSFLAHPAYQDGLFALLSRESWRAIANAGLTQMCQSGYDAHGNMLSDSVCLGYANLLGPEVAVEYLRNSTLPGDTVLWSGGRSAVVAKIDAVAADPQPLAPAAVPVADAGGGGIVLVSLNAAPRATAAAGAPTLPGSGPARHVDRFGVFGLDVSAYTDRPLQLASAGSATVIGGPGAGSGMNGIGTGSFGVVPVQSTQTGTSAGTGSSTASSDSMSQPGCSDEVFQAQTEAATQAVEDSIGRRQNQTQGPASVLEGSCFDFQKFTDISDISVLFDPTKFLQGLIKGMESRVCDEFNSAFNSAVGGGFKGTDFFTPMGSSVPTFGSKGALDSLLGSVTGGSEISKLLHSGSGTTRNFPSSITSIPVLNAVAK